MRMIAEEGCGVMLYLHNTSRGFEIDRTPAAAFGPEGAAAPPGAGAQTAASFCTRSCAPAKAAGPQRADSARHRPGRPDSVGPGHSAHPLLSNTPMHIPALEGFGLEIVEQVAIPVEECRKAVVS